MKELLGEGMAGANLRSGGKLRLELDGESFVRAICKLTHVGAKQYEKGKTEPPTKLLWFPLPATFIFPKVMA
jgi:hypothetical protein